MLKKRQKHAQVVFRLDFFHFLIYYLIKSMKNVKEVISNLNKLSKQNFSAIGSTEFYFGNTVLKTQEIANMLIPFGIAVFLCNEKDYKEKVEPVEKALLLKGIKVRIIFNPRDGGDVVIPENARMIISFGNEYFNLAGKIATEKNLYCLFIIDQFNFDDTLNSYFEIYKDNKKSRVRLDFDRRILLDVEKIIDDEKGCAEEFAFVMSKLISLVDYRIFGIITETPTNKKAYSLIKSAVEETYSLLSKIREDYLLTLIENAIKVRLADAITLGSFYKNSAPDICAKLHGDRNSSLFYAKRIAKIYTLAFSSEYDGVASPDYLERAENLSKLESSKETDYSKWLVYQSNLCAEKEKQISVVKEILYTETFNYLKIFDLVEKTYIALGGKKITPNDAFVKISGDFYETFNGMTLVRDCGISEFL